MDRPDIGNEQVSIRALADVHGFSVYLLPIAAYPIPGEQRPAHLQILKQLSDSLEMVHRVPHQFLLQMWNLHHQAASKQLSIHGRTWLPAIGLGVWPCRPPPALWTKEEFESFVPGEVPRPPMFTVFRLGGSWKDVANVPLLMAGRGAMIQIGVTGDLNKFYSSCELHFRNFIQEPLPLAFPFFFPLLDVRGMASLGGEDANTILGSIQYYSRESVEDGGHILFSRAPLDDVFRDLRWNVQKDSIT